ncbi:hypothetical protein [Gordonia jacobaea]|uniref:hypothetical protein n=1 Tax=Gordonia jacobaea TaxID=122202 RepID=UPI0022E582D4|nr:hypothetical protein [Gordonia jacobaea]
MANDDKERSAERSAREELEVAQQERDRRREETEKEEAERDDAAKEHGAVKSALRDGEDAAERDVSDLDKRKLDNIRAMLGKEGGAAEVTKKYGAHAMGSPEARLAQQQLQRGLAREREAFERNAREQAEKAGHEKTKTPMRDRAIEQERQRQQDRERGVSSRGR